MRLNTSLNLWLAAVITIAGCLLPFGAIAEAQTSDSPESPYVKCWEFSFEGALPFPALTNNGSVYVPEQGGRIRALDARTGKTLWTNEMGGSIASNFIINNGRLHVITNPSIPDPQGNRVSILWNLNPDSGLTIGSTKLPFSESMYLGASEELIISVGTAGIIAGHDHNGALRWSKALSVGQTAVPSIRFNRIAIAGENRRIFFIDANTGGTLKERKWANKITAIGLTGSEDFVFGDERGNVIRSGALSSSPVWKFKAGGSITQIATFGDELAITSLDNFLYIISGESGDVRWRKRLVGRALHLPLVLEDRILAASYGESSIPISDIRGGKTVNRIDIGTGAYLTRMPQVTDDAVLIVTVPGAIIAFDKKACIR